MAKQPTYPHDIVKKYVWWIERGRIGIAYHDLDDGNNGSNLEFLSPHNGYTAKIVASTIAFNDNGGSPDTITDSASNFLNAGFAAEDEITITGSSTAGNNVTATIVSVVAGTITLATGTLGATVAAGSEITIGAGTAVKARIFVTKKAEVADGGKFVITDLDDYPEFPEQFHETLVQYVIARGYERRSSIDPKFLQLSQYWQQRYLVGVGEARMYTDTNQVSGPRVVTTNSTTGII